MMVVTAVEAVLIIVLNVNVSNVKIACPPRGVWKSKRVENVADLGLSLIAPRPVVTASLSFERTPNYFQVEQFWYDVIISMQTTSRIVFFLIAFQNCFYCDLFRWNM